MSRTSTVTLPPTSGIHVGIIMDGNGRWAASRGLPRSAGHHAGVRTARAIVESAVRAGIGTLTIVGRRDRLPAALRGAIADAEAVTARCRNLHLRVAIDYSSRDGILLAAERYAQQVARGPTEPLTRERF